MAGIVNGSTIVRQLVRGLPFLAMAEQTTNNFTGGGDNLAQAFDISYIDADHNQLQGTLPNPGFRYSVGLVLDVMVYQDSPTGDGVLDVYIGRSTSPSPSRRLFEFNLLGPGVFFIHGMRLPCAKLIVQWASNDNGVGNAEFGAYIRNS